MVPMIKRHTVRFLCGALLVCSWIALPGTSMPVDAQSAPSAKRPLSYDTIRRVVVDPGHYALA